MQVRYFSQILFQFFFQQISIGSTQVKGCKAPIHKLDRIFEANVTEEKKKLFQG